MEFVKIRIVHKCVVHTGLKLVRPKEPALVRVTLGGPLGGSGQRLSPYACAERSEWGARWAPNLKNWVLRAFSIKIG